VTGFSNGAAFSVVMACRSELNIVAVAPVAYATGPCEGDVDSPIVAFHGTGDGTVPYDGSGFDVLSILLGVGSGPAEEVISDWAAFNGCGDLEEIELAADVDKLEWSACAASTTFYRIANGGHSWPGSGVEVRFGATTDSISASELIVEFFAAQLG
jgi:polyhydroxybutyrate depolymerase